MARPMGAVGAKSPKAASTRTAEYALRPRILEIVENCFTVKGEGIVQPRGSRKGDLIFEVAVEIPKNLSEKQKDILRSFAEESGQKNYQKKQSFFKKFKK